VNKRPGSELRFFFCFGIQRSRAGYTAVMALSLLMLLAQMSGTLRRRPRSLLV
jgi:hypothetical protein